MCIYAIARRVCTRLISPSVDFFDIRFCNGSTAQSFTVAPLRPSRLREPLWFA